MEYNVGLRQGVDMGPAENTAGDVDEVQSQQLNTAETEHIFLRICTNNNKNNEEEINHG